ncbi:hypothetical protein ACOME3_000384 [Neoechinorhynchus agilis]
MERQNSLECQDLRGEEVHENERKEGKETAQEPNAETSTATSMYTLRSDVLEPLGRYSFETSPWDRLLNENIATLLVVSNGDEYNETEVIDNIANILCCIESKDNKEALRSRLLRYDQTHRPRHQRSSHLLLDHSDSIIAEIERLHKFTELENDK